MKKTILIAEDEKTIRLFSERFLRNAFPDYNIECFEDGKSLDERLDQSLEGVCAVVTDNQMPGMKGSEIIRKHATKLKDIPFILYHAGDEIIGEDAMKNGACGYVSKLSLPIYQGVLDILKKKLE